ncbi:MAG: methyltransferase domain-containing protein [Myxococcaceae bacterium]|nr:methyltransferase domain-containing protein [Myxococcaceae bacterium]
MLWNPGQYSKFARQRLQPGLDLIARLPEIAAERVVDLGCGTGELTELLASRFPSAEVLGVDSSEEMLARARQQPGARARYERGDIATWAPLERVQVLFSNAAYQWLPSHAELFTRLLSFVEDAGVFAAQMPRNFDAPSHAVMRELAMSSRFKGRIELRHEPVLSPQAYYDVLAAHAREVEIWETEYLHVLEGEDPVFEWTRGTALLPVYAALEGEALEAFLTEYKQRLRAAYPRRPDGRTLFPFRRIFMLARR